MSLFVFVDYNSSSVSVWTTGFRGARSAPNSAGMSKPVKSDFVPFEVRINDFPELAGGKSASCHVGNWRPTSSSTGPPKQPSTFSWTVSLKYHTMRFSAKASHEFGNIFISIQ